MTDMVAIQTAVDWRSERSPGDCGVEGKEAWSRVSCQRDSEGCAVSHHCSANVRILAVSSWLYQYLSGSILLRTGREKIRNVKTSTH